MPFNRLIGQFVSFLPANSAKRDSTNSEGGIKQSNPTITSSYMPPIHFWSLIFIQTTVRAP